MMQYLEAMLVVDFSNKISGCAEHIPIGTLVFRKDLVISNQS